MKNNRFTAMLICALLLGSLLASCARINSTKTDKESDASAPAATVAVASAVSPSELPTPSPSAEPEQATPETASSEPVSTAPSSGFMFEEQTYEDAGIAITYPRITGQADTAAQDKLNKLISDTALFDMAARSEDMSFTDYQLRTTITCNTPAIVSMYFEGYANVEGAAHPYQFLRTRTIDAANQQVVTLSQLIIVDESFMDVLLNGQYSSMSFDMTDEYAASIKQYLTESESAFLVDALKSADTDSASVYSFLTEDALVLSVSVPHVMGDHVEIYLPFKDLHGYQTDNIIWQYIEK